ncbi:MAG: hypothetical protein PHF51_02900 [Candidatus ainarchaeum sp.]|nr:hypothetical protein [Candidatus ainarchaeum sp.]
MRDNPEKALADARVWLKSAEDAFARAGEAERAEVVACAEAIHAIIRANDALTMALLGLKGTRHDDSPMLFGRLLREKKIEARHAKFATLVFKAVEAKSGADYGRSEICGKEAEYFVRGAREFLEMAEKSVAKK